MMKMRKDMRTYDKIYREENVTVKSQKAQK